MHEASIVVPELTQVTHRDQFYKEDGTFYVQDDIFSATIRVFDKQSATPTVAIFTVVLDRDSVFYDTPQTDSGWTQDTVGYNFKYTVPGIYFPKGGHAYRVELEAVTVSDTVDEPEAKHVRTWTVKTKGVRTV